MDILFEILIELYMECMFLIVPEGKRSRRHTVLTKLVAVLVTLGVMAMGCWGIVWIWQTNNPWGWLPLGVAVLLSLLQITLGIVLYIRRMKKKRTINGEE